MCLFRPAESLSYNFRTILHFADVLLWSFAKLLVTFQERQYLFAAQCIWWIAALVQLDPALRYLINNQKFLLETSSNTEKPELDNMQREISATPWDIHRRSPIEDYQPPDQYQADPL